MFKVNAIALRKMMLDKKINTISALSKCSGIGRDTLGRVLSGDIIPSTKVMYRIAESLEMTPHQAGECFFAQEKGGEE